MTDINALLNSYSFHGRLDDMDYEIGKQLILDEVVMPAFHTFDKPTPVYRVNVDADHAEPVITVIDENGDTVGGTFTNLAAAYDYVGNDLKGDVVFSGDLKSVTGDDDPMFVTVPTEDGKFSRLLISHTDLDGQWLAKHDYYAFLQLALRYEQNPNDFYTCFYFLDTHPAFWHRYNAEGNDWSRSGGAGKIWIGITKDDDGNPVVMLETGAAIEPTRINHYHDLRLDTYSDTYENGIIKMAALVHKFYDVDGSERENVDYQKSALEVTLEERVKEMNKILDETPEASEEDKDSK